MEEKLFTLFPPVSTEEWEEAIKNDLKGADYDKKLVWKTDENIAVRPYYRAENLENLFHLAWNGTFPFAKDNGADWKVRQDFIVDDMGTVNEQALTAIKNGVNSVGFDISGIKTFTKDAFYKLMYMICPEMTEVNFICNEDNAEDLLSILRNFFTDEKLIAERIYFNIEFNPFKAFMLKEQNCLYGIDILKNLLINCSFAPNMRVGIIDASIFGNCGSTLTEELAFGLVSAADLLDFLTETGLSIDNICKRLKFKFSAGSNYFFEIAKFRAARYLWAKVVDAYSPKDAASTKMYLHAETSTWNKTLYDPYVNLLRTTTESMSSILGGIDSLTVTPFNLASAQNDDFAMRLARNQQLLLKEESHFDKITDPAAGSYYIENLTSCFIKNAWDLFLSIIDKGGFINCFKEDIIQDIILESSQKRDLAIATRKENFVGVNLYPNITEHIDFTEQEKPQEEEALSCCCCEEEVAHFKTLQPYRGPEAFERMRLKTELFSKTTGRRPKVFLFTYGSLSMRIARAGFASNFFGCAGFEIINTNGFASLEDGINAAKDSGAEIVTVCSSDEEYETIAPQIYEELKNDSIIVVAGNPKDCMEKLTAVGIKHFIHVKTNVLESLTSFQKMINIL